MIGSTVSHYEILDRVGTGGMGVVYRARDLRLDRIVALKFLSPELSLNPEERKRFVREAQAASALDHANIGVVFDVDEAPDGRTFIAMAFYSGETLKQKLAVGVSLETALKIIIQVAQGLGRAHALGIIHRDIKPSNIIVTAEVVCMEWLDFVIKSGRAVLYPVYQGTYERKVPPIASDIAFRDLTVMRVKDLRRSIDYLETRTDIRNDQIGYYGASLGAIHGPYLALENRVRAAVLADGAFPPSRWRPEIDPLNFAPRLKIPVLMINGRYDFVQPLETQQKPMFRSFGTNDLDKRHVVLDTTHYAMVARSEVVREVLGWFDKYLGPLH